MFGKKQKIQSNTRQCPWTTTYPYYCNLQEAN